MRERLSAGVVQFSAHVGMLHTVDKSVTEISGQNVAFIFEGQDNLKEFLVFSCH